MEIPQSIRKALISHIYAQILNKSYCQINIYLLRLHSARLTRQKPCNIYFYDSNSSLPNVLFRSISLLMLRYHNKMTITLYLLSIYCLPGVKRMLRSQQSLGGRGRIIFFIFTILINSISQSLSSSCYHIYAYDFQIYTQAQLHKLPESKQNGDVVNTSKTQLIVVSSPRIVSRIDFTQLPIIHNVYKQI